MAFLLFIRRLGWSLLLLALGGLAIAVWIARVPSANLPWTPLELDVPPGAFTRAKLLQATASRDACQDLLRRSGVSFRPVPAFGVQPACRVGDAVRWNAGGLRTADYRPGAPALACPLAAALTGWELTVVQPAAARAFASPVAQIEHVGSFACRRIEGRAGASWSEHARADAIDVAGFRLENGRRITVARNWRGSDREARFLRTVRDGACRWFGTTLSPDYDRAHRDHLHLDAAPRAFGACR